MPETKPQIHKRMAAILDEMPAIGKDAYNQGLKFNFRSVDAILNELNPLLGKHGVFIVPRVMEVRTEALQPKGRMAVVTVEYRFVADDGSEIVAISAGEGHDYGDKSVSKAATMALKTCLGQVFAIATDDDPDGDSVQTSGQTQAPTARAAGEGAAGPRTGAPAAPPAEQPWMTTKAKVDTFLATGTAGYDGRREQLIAQMNERGLPLDLATSTPEQLAATEALVVDLTAPF